MTTPGVLVLLRHGESVANAAKEFTGRHDVGVTPRGEEQARRAAQLMRDADVRPDTVVTSPMVRALRTAELVMDELSLPVPELVEDWRLVERDYGCLTGMPKQQARQELGPDRFVTLRRTRHGRPPALAAEVRAGLDLYEAPGTDLPPAGGGESLDDVVGRVEVTWDRVRSAVVAGTSVLLVAHGNTLRAFCTLVDGLSDEEVVHLNVPAGQPLLYHLDGAGRPTLRGGRYLDPGTAREQTALIAAEGGT